MDEQDENYKDEKLAENIFEKWSLEEISFYYELMLWQHATKDENIMKYENNMWGFEIPTTYDLNLKAKYDKHTWQKAIDESKDIDKRIRPKEHEEEQKKKVKMTKKARRMAEFKIQSLKKKKKLHESVANKVKEINFVKQCKPS